MMGENWLRVFHEVWKALASSDLARDRVPLRCARQLATWIHNSIGIYGILDRFQQLNCYRRCRLDKLVTLFPTNTMFRAYAAIEFVNQIE
ncbi:hypothetical protein FHS20_004009 [Phyllobacterium endophyticum]|nr:hypothetical protein [Phyllobacterium endophyticum]